MLTLLNTMRQDLGLSQRGFVSLLFLVMVGSAFAGWVYEMLFYYVDAGGQWVARGHGMGPWLPIYGFGVLGIIVCLLGCAYASPAGHSALGAGDGAP